MFVTVAGCRAGLSLSVTVLPSNSTVKAGKNVTVACDVSLSMLLRWEFKQRGFGEVNVYRNSRVDSKWQHRISVQPDPANNDSNILTIWNVAVSDTGNLTCYNRRGDHGSAALYVIASDVIRAGRLNLIVPLLIVACCRSIDGVTLFNRINFNCTIADYA